jgi:hypothetical protein
MMSVRTRSARKMTTLAVLLAFALVAYFKAPEIQTAMAGGGISLASNAIAVPADVQAELSRLPVGTVIVPCNSSRAVLDDDARPSRPLGFYDFHPGWVDLSHGYCADNPSATPRPLLIPNMDGPAQ